MKHLINHQSDHAICLNQDAPAVSIVSSSITSSMPWDPAVSAYLSDSAHSRDRAGAPIFSAAQIMTPLGPMMAISDETKLYLLEFIDRSNLLRQLKRLKKGTRALIIPGETPPIQSIILELNRYFAHELTEFKTPLSPIGSPFQCAVWEGLKKIPYGSLLSYSQLASLLGSPKSYRAVANATGANPLAIIIPCHRLIEANGGLGGYAGGLPRKNTLIEHEKKA